MSIINSRLKRWRLGYIEDLWAEALEAAAEREKRRDAPKNNRQFASDLGPFDFSAPEDVDSLSEKDLQAVHRAVQAGNFAKAATRMASATVAKTDDKNAEILKTKHPQDADVLSSDCPPPAANSETAPDNFTPQEIRRNLGKFPRGSAAGTDGCSPNYLAELVRTPGSNMDVDLARMCSLIANGLTPPSIRPLLFGARLIALIKVNLDLRPIAAGIAIRRLTAKTLSTKEQRHASTFFLKVFQVGVGVSNGATAVVQAARRLAEAIMTDPAFKDVVYFKSDFDNAFNAVYRKVMLQLVKEHFPTLYPYAWSAYKSASHLLFGSHLLRSARGVQQGDPLGPLFFCLVLVKAVQLAKAALGSDVQLLLEAWYMDDGNMGMHKSHLSSWIGALTAASAEVGLTLNQTKCEIYAHKDNLESLKQQFPTMKVLPIEDLYTLGCPCGSTSATEAWAATKLEKAAKRNQAIARVPAAHEAFTLLRFCGGSPLAVYFLRAAGYVPAVDDFDKSTFDAFQQIIATDLSAAQLAIVGSPPRQGGLGLIPAKVIATGAIVASTITSKPVADSFFNLPESFPLPPETYVFEALQRDSTFATSPAAKIIIAALRKFLPAESHQLNSRFPAEDPRWTLSEDELEYFEQNCKSPKGKLQRVFTRFCLLHSNPIGGHPLPDRASALSRSANSRHSNSMFQQSPEVIDHAMFDTWVPSEIFIAVTKVRLGCAITPTTVPCPLCASSKGHKEADVHGDHALKCKSYQAVASNELRNLLGTILVSANRTVAYEIQCFTGCRERVDVYARTAAGADAIDVFITHDKCGKVEEYASKKHTKYGSLVRMEPNTALIAFGCDSFFAWCKEAHHYISSWCKSYATNLLIPHRIAKAVIFAQLNAAVARGFYKKVVAQAAASPCHIAPGVAPPTLAYAAGSVGGGQH